jgi:riboflavin kinase/FMN adenylyltransferase
MRVVRGLNQLGQVDQPTFVTIGNFDGLHLGHRKIIEELIKRSKISEGKSVVVTFDPHPRKVLEPGKPLRLITSMQHRLKLLGELGVGLALILQFDDAFASISADSFVRELLFPKLRFSELIVGRNYVFGKGRLGNAALLEQLSRELGFKIDFVEPVKQDHQFISSSFLRQLIREGALDKASEFLGRPFSVFGTVVHGRGIGAEMGFATANLNLEGIILPPRGVYAVEVEFNEERCVGLANVGVRPTFGGSEQEDQVEVHLIDFDREIYGCPIEVIFMEKIRDEIRFESPERLRDQIQIDVENVRAKFLPT